MFLELFPVAVEGIDASCMVPDSIGKMPRFVWLNHGAICTTRTACPVKSFL